MKANYSNTVYTLGCRLSDGRTLQALYTRKTDEKKFVVFSSDGSYIIVDHYQDPATGVDYHPTNDNAIRSGSIVLPSDVGEQMGMQDLHMHTTAFISKYFDANASDIALSADYVISTYFYDQLEKTGYLRFYGPPNSGKSRALKVLRSISRNSINLGSAVTSANIFRTVDRYGYNTVIMDEFNFENTGRNDNLVQVLNSGYSQDGIVTRCNPPSYEPKPYQVFGPKIIANHSTFEDLALESRMLTVKTMETSRNDIPESIADIEKSDEAEFIRNALLRARIEKGNKVNTSIKYSSLSQYDTRTIEIVTPLLIAQNLVEVPDYLFDYLNRRQNDLQLIKKTDNNDIVKCVISEFMDRGQENVLLSDITQKTGEFLGYPIHPKTVNNILRQMGFISTHGQKGTIVHLGNVQGII